MGNNRKILIAVDGSKPSNKAFAWYLENMQRPTDTVVLVHTPEYHVHMPLPGVAADFEAISKGVKDEDVRISGMLAVYMEQLRHAGIKAYQLVRPGKKPGEDIIQAAEEEGVGSIVMGSRGLGKLRRTLMGSVSDYVSQHAPCNCAVTIVRDS